MSISSLCPFRFCIDTESVVEGPEGNDVNLRGIKTVLGSLRTRSICVLRGSLHSPCGECVSIDKVCTFER